MTLMFVVSFLTALTTGWLLLRFEHVHARLSYDHSASGPQKFHARPTPRIGGVPVAVGASAGLVMLIFTGSLDRDLIFAFGIAVLPAFASGLFEDLSKKLGADMRLWASFLSALLAVLVFDAVVDRSGIPAVDALLTWYPLALVVTVIGVGGVAHAMNLIDGYNGLAGVVATMMYAALAFVCWQVEDFALLAVCLALAGSTLGFLYWNFPGGRIFAGDGGAYLWGVSVAIVSVLLVHRHPQVSPWFPLVVVLYPVVETLFSVYRRKFKQAAAAGLPDAKHLHQLIYRRVLSPPLHAVADAATRTRRNSATSPFLWALAALILVPSVFFWRDSAALMGLATGFCLIYVWLYRSIVRFSTPRMLRRLGRRAAQA